MELEERKAIGPDGVSGFFLKESRNQLVAPVYDSVQYQLVKYLRNDTELRSSLYIKAETRQSL